jgi:uncharacterized protein (DUF58 family)
MSFGKTPMPGDTLELVQRRIYLLPTARGWFIVITAVVVLLVGINYQLSLAFVVAFLLAGLLQAALLVSYRNLRGLIVRAGRSPHCVLGESLTFSVAITSPERTRDGVRLRAQAGTGRNFYAGSAPKSISQDQTEAVQLSFTATQRGTLALQRITIESSAPYGLIRAWSYVHFEWLGIVAPQPETPPPPLPLKAGENDGAASRHAHVAHDPDSLRDYVAGDSLKRVAWKQVAKSGEWYTRTGDSGQRQEIELSWQAVSLTDTEARLSRMAAWLLRAHNENCAYELTMPNGHLALADGAQQLADATLLLAAYPRRIETLHGLR